LDILLNKNIEMKVSLILLLLLFGA